MVYSLALSSDDSSSSDKDEKVFSIICELTFPLKVLLGTKLHLEDLSPLQCEQLFRYACVIFIKINS